MIRALISLFFLAQVSSAATLADLEGNVERRAGDKAPWTAAVKGAALADGSSLRLGAGAKAAVAFDDGSRVDLAENTTFTLDRDSDKGRAVGLAAGLLRALIRKPSPGFAVRTPTAVAAVRGTEFTVGVDRAGRTKVRVYSGAVSVRDKKGRETLLQPDQSLEASAAGLGRPAAVAPSFEDPASGWRVDPPEGFTPRPVGPSTQWEKLTDETVLVGTRRIKVSHQERVEFAGEPLPWEEGQSWPRRCEPGETASPTNRSSIGGYPVFDVVCTVGGGQRPFANGTPGFALELGRKLRKRFVAADFDGKASMKALRLVYVHTIRAFNFDGTPASFEAQQAVANRNGGDLDGPGTAAYLASAASLRPAPSAAPAAPPPAAQPAPDEHQAVPLLR
jgi:hypothetical protein